MRTHKHKKRTQSEAGFTLLEVVVAIAILTFGMLAVASMQSSAIQGNYTARIHTEAATWAQDRMEKLLALPYSDSLLTDTGTLDPEQYVADPFSPSPAGYTIEYLVDDDTIPNAKVIRVKIERTDNKGLTRPYKLTVVKPSL